MRKGREYWSGHVRAWRCSGLSKKSYYALFDMFCGLNGATHKPRRFAARHSPATTTDFPASDAVPWIMIARALTPPPSHANSRPLPSSGSEAR